MTLKRSRYHDTNRRYRPSKDRKPREDAEMPEGQEYICGICGEPGADKMAKWTGGAIYWPGELRPDGDIVHADCEREECERAHSNLSQAQRDRVIDDARKYGMNPIPKGYPR